MPVIDAVRKESLSDSLARAVKQMIDREGFEPGYRLPTIQDMARRFEVGAPTLREALRRLQAVGIVEIRHGSGVYVAEGHDALFLSNPVAEKVPSRRAMLDLIETRLVLEVYTTGLAAERVTEVDIAEMERQLDKAAALIDEHNDKELSRINMAFHGQIALASGNGVAHQVLEVLSGLFRAEQYAILGIHGSRVRDYHEHVGILNALKARNASLAVRRMRAHLNGVRRVLMKQDSASIDRALNGKNNGNA
jgi:GntR family transcriptional repressor for pyruvate dehydrogenase complex